MLMFSALAIRHFAPEKVQRLKRQLRILTAIEFVNSFMAQPFLYLWPI